MIATGGGRGSRAGGLSGNGAASRSPRGRGEESGLRRAHPWRRPARKSVFPAPPRGLCGCRRMSYNPARCFRRDENRGYAVDGISSRIAREFDRHGLVLVSAGDDGSNGRTDAPVRLRLPRGVRASGPRPEKRQQGRGRQRRSGRREPARPRTGARARTARLSRTGTPSACGATGSEARVGQPRAESLRDRRGSTERRLAGSCSGETTARGRVTDGLRKLGAPGPLSARTAVPKGLLAAPPASSSANRMNVRSLMKI